MQIDSRVAYRTKQIPRPYRFGTAGGGDDRSAKPSSTRIATDNEDLPFRVELWNEEKTAVEAILAVTANASIGYAAFYEASREFPSRYVTLKQKGQILSRWNGPHH